MTDSTDAFAICTETITAAATKQSLPTISVIEGFPQHCYGVAVGVYYQGLLQGSFVAWEESSVGEKLQAALVKAWSDARYQPLALAALPDCTFEISFMSEPEPITNWHQPPHPQYSYSVGVGGSIVAWYVASHVASEDMPHTKALLDKLIYTKTSLAPADHIEAHRHATTTCYVNVAPTVMKELSREGLLKDLLRRITPTGFIRLYGISTKPADQKWDVGRMSYIAHVLDRCAPHIQNEVDQAKVALLHTYLKEHHDRFNQRQRAYHHLYTTNDLSSLAAIVNTKYLSRDQLSDMEVFAGSLYLMRLCEQADVHHDTVSTVTKRLYTEWVRTQDEAMLVSYVPVLLGAHKTKLDAIYQEVASWVLNQQAEEGYFYDRPNVSETNNRTTAKLFEVLSQLPEMSDSCHRALTWLAGQQYTEASLGVIAPERRDDFKDALRIRPNSHDFALDISAHILAGLS